MCPTVIRNVYPIWWKWHTRPYGVEGAILERHVGSSPTIGGIGVPTRNRNFTGGKQGDVPEDYSCKGLESSCGCDSMVRIPAFQAGYEGSIPFSRSNKRPRRLSVRTSGFQPEKVGFNSHRGHHNAG